MGLAQRLRGGTETLTYSVNLWDTSRMLKDSLLSRLLKKVHMQGGERRAE
jgi:hypothetical protein